ncbi:MAG: hypothetical protein ACE14S_06905 [Candidatus Bathyarchaeia archaeon]
MSEEGNEIKVTVKKEENSEIERLQQELEHTQIELEQRNEVIKAIAIKKINEKIEQLGIPESEADYFRQNPEALKGYEIGQKGKQDDDKNSGRGTLPTSLNNVGEDGRPHNSGNGKREFDSAEEMLEYCRLHDKESYEKIKAKTAQGLLISSFEWKDTFTKDEKGNDRSLIGRTLDRINEDARRKAGFKGVE